MSVLIYKLLIHSIRSLISIETLVGIRGRHILCNSLEQRCADMSTGQFRCTAIFERSRHRMLQSTILALIYLNLIRWTLNAIIKPYKLSQFFVRGISDWPLCPCLVWHHWPHYCSLVLSSDRLSRRPSSLWDPQRTPTKVNLICLDVPYVRWRSLRLGFQTTKDRFAKQISDQ